MVRAAAAGAHSPLHDQVVARRDRAGRERRFHALPARLAGRDARSRGRKAWRAWSASSSSSRASRSPAVAWESDVLPARLRDYDAAWLDSLCLSGRAFWARLDPPQSASAAPVRATPMALLTRGNRALWQQLSEARRPEPQTQLSANARAMAEFLQRHGASFFDEMVQGAGLLPAQAESALGELVAAGLASADSFGGLRALLLPMQRKRAAARGAARRSSASPRRGAGAWCGAIRRLRRRLQSVAPRRRAAPRHAPSQPSSSKRSAWVLLRRYGVVFRRLLAREAEWLPPWHQLLRAYRRLEAQGLIRGGRFVAAMSGEQYALPDAVGALRAMPQRAPDGALVALSGADPLNLAGIVTPGPRLAALAGNRLLLQDGVPSRQSRRRDAFPRAVPPDEQWQLRSTLLRQRHKTAARDQQQLA